MPSSGNSAAKGAAPRALERTVEAGYRPTHMAMPSRISDRPAAGSRSCPAQAGSAFASPPGRCPGPPLSGVIDDGACRVSMLGKDSSNRRVASSISATVLEWPGHRRTPPAAAARTRRWLLLPAAGNAPSAWYTARACAPHLRGEPHARERCRPPRRARLQPRSARKRSSRDREPCDRWNAPQW